VSPTDFPRTADQRVYHLGLRAGDVANRIVTVGSPSRAQAIAAFFDKEIKPFVLSSERGFLTITGRFKNVPVSVISIGMGSANMDFFVREVRECLSGDMVIVRLGSCGALIDVPVGTVVVPRASVSVTRNVDFDFGSADSLESPYRISRPVGTVSGQRCLHSVNLAQVHADAALHDELQKALAIERPLGFEILTDTVNASADSFYSSQGRHTSFPDHNEHLIDKLQASTPGLVTLEMETFHLYHLAVCWRGRQAATRMSPLTERLVEPVISLPPASVFPTTSLQLASPETVIRAAAVHMVFASRTSQEFITPNQVTELERWT
ncbi:Purine nucleoside phosphorylase deoD-type, partial [Termitomyces sp. J132]